MTKKIYEGEVIDYDISNIPPISEYYEEVAKRIADRMSVVFMTVLLLALCLAVSALLFMDMDTLRVALWGH